MKVELATSDYDMIAAQRLFESAFTDIAPDAVPMTDWGRTTYNVVVAVARDDRRIVGAALTCRSQVAIHAAALGRDAVAYSKVLDKHSELDLLAVSSECRGQGIGQDLIAFLEDHLRSSGVEVWFGNATRDLDIEGLRHFYETTGFEVCANGEPLPELLGLDWNIPGQHLGEKLPAFYFFKRLDGDGGSDTGPSDRKIVTPPDPRKARRTGLGNRRGGRR